MKQEVDELAIIYQFLQAYRETGGIHKDGVRYAVFASYGDDTDANTAWASGDTIKEAILKLYDELEKGK